MLNPIVVYHMNNPLIDEKGTKRWRNKNGQLHRTDGPAEIYKNGTKCWYQNGQCHRTDGPAVIWEDGEEYWYINDKPIKPIPDHIILWRKKLNDK